MNDTRTLTSFPRIGLSGMRSVVVTLGVAGWLSVSAKADEMPTKLGYSSLGFVGSTIRDDAISIKGVAGGSFLKPGTLTLGSFKVSLPTGADTRTYDGTPFFIQTSFTRSDGVHEEAAIMGHLDGILKAGSTSLLHAAIDRIQPLAETADGTPNSPSSGSSFHGILFPLKDLRIVGSLDIPVSADGQGEISIIAEVRAVPEPSTLAILVASVIGFAVTRAYGRQRRG